MIEILTLNALFLVLAGVLIGIAGVVIGGSMFFSIPFLQFLFPGISFGALIGNIKMGSFFRGIGSTISTAKQIDWKRNIILSFPLIFGTILGAWGIAELDQKWILPAIIIAVILAEIAPYVATKINNKHFTAFSLLIGGYTGFLGAGIGIFLIALLRTKNPSDTDIANVKIQARFIEWLLVIVAVLTHIFHANIIAEIWIPWAIGGIIGGYIGGKILHKIGKLSGKVQKIILRIAFALSIVIAVVKVL